MKKIFLYSFIATALFLCPINTRAQNKTIDTIAIKKVMIEEAKKMRSFFIQKKFDSFAQYIHPKLIEMVGDKQVLVKAIANELQKMEFDDFKITNVKIGKSYRIENISNELQCVIEEIFIIKTGDKTISANGHLIGISTDLGKSWYFIDSRSKPIEELQKTFPKLSNKLIIPERSKPQEITN